MKYLAIIPAIILVSACSTTAAPLDPDFGTAVKAANSAQIVNPAAVSGAPTPDPTVQGNALERYKADEVKQPKNQSIDGN